METHIDKSVSMFKVQCSQQLETPRPFSMPLLNFVQLLYFNGRLSPFRVCVELLHTRS